MFKVSRKEFVYSLPMLVLLLAFEVMCISHYFDAFAYHTLDDTGLFYREFKISGYDPITYSVITKWGAVYDIYRHPLLAFMVYPLYLLNSLLASSTGCNLAQIVIAVVWLFCAYFSFIFLFRILRDIVGIASFDAILLSYLYFSFAYILLAVIVPDHFVLSMFLLLLALYVSGKYLRDGRQLSVAQTVCLFFLTAGVTLSNGIKIFIDALFVNGKRFFRPVFLLFGVLIPCAVIWGFASWEYQRYEVPRKEKQRQQRVKQERERRTVAYTLFLDTTTIADSAMWQKVFKAEYKQMRLKEERSSVFNRHRGRPMGTSKFMRWTDATTSRVDAIVENMFGESIQLHADHLLEDTLVSRPVFVKYRHIYQYIVEGLLMLFFIFGGFLAWRSRFFWMVFCGFLVDVAIHLILGFGINEIYIMSAHWLFVVPIAVSFVFSRVSGRGLQIVRAFFLLLAAYLWVYNGSLIIGYLSS